MSKKLIKEICRRHNLRQKELAVKCGVSLRTVQGWAVGRKPSGAAAIILQQLSA